MINSGKKNFALCTTKKIYSNSCVVRKKNSPPPLQVKWSVPYSYLFCCFVEIKKYPCGAFF